MSIQDKFEDFIDSGTIGVALLFTFILAVCLAPLWVPLLALGWLVERTAVRLKFVPPRETKHEQD